MLFSLLHYFGFLRIPGNKWAFQQAKSNLLNKYLLVGVTDQMEEFVAVLEATLPMYFKGALDLYRQGGFLCLTFKVLWIIVLLS